MRVFPDPASAGTAHAGRTPGWIPSSSSPAEGPEGVAASENGSSAGSDEEDEAHLGQACSICGYRKPFLHDKHNARTCGARSRERASSASVPAEFRAEVFRFSNTTEKTKLMPEGSCVRCNILVDVISVSCLISASCCACRTINR